MMVSIDSDAKKVKIWQTLSEPEVDAYDFGAQVPESLMRGTAR